MKNYLTGRKYRTAVVRAVMAKPTRVRKGVALKLNAFWTLSSWLAIQPRLSLNIGCFQEVYQHQQNPTWTFSTISCICLSVLALLLSTSSSTSSASISTTASEFFLPLVRVRRNMFLKRTRLQLGGAKDT